jgi:signal recognition particle receptor subunit beta
MVQFNFSERTIKAKVVYYGPPQSGKTTNLEQIHRLTDPDGANRLISLNTAQDRTLFFDLLPFSLGSVSGYDFKIQLYTVPGQVQYNATRRVVLAGADAVVFVADSQKQMTRENHNAFENMKVNLLANRLVPEKVPLVLQYNKQDLGDLAPRAELDRLLNQWGRKAFPAVAARGRGVLDTFVAVVQDMLTSIALKYNLREKGLDPAAVPDVVAQAFSTLVSRLPPPPPEPTPPSGVPTPPRRVSPARVVIAQPPSAEAAFPVPSGAEANPVSEELLHRAIRSNVELAEALGAVVRAMSLGLDSVAAQAGQLAAAGGDTAASLAGGIQREVARMRKTLRGLGQMPEVRAGAPPRASTGAVRVGGDSGARGAPTPSSSPPPLPATAVSPASGAGAATLDALVDEVIGVIRPPLDARGLGVTHRIPRGTNLPRCSPAGLRRALASLVRGIAASVPDGSALIARAERKPVLLRGRDGRELRRDFVMLALTHASGLADADQQRVLNGTDAGPLGEAYRLVREMGGFMRFAPLPGAILETRTFLPL